MRGAIIALAQFGLRQQLRLGMIRSLSALLASTVIVTMFGMLLLAQGQTGLTVITPDGRETLPTVEHDGEEMIPLDVLGQRFGLDVSEDRAGGRLTVTTPGGAIILTAGQQLVSVAGRLVSLRGEPIRARGAWLVPLDFLSRALSGLVGQPIELRPRSRLVLVGDVRVPRVAARYEAQTDGGGRLVVTLSPNTAHSVERNGSTLVIGLEAEAMERDPNRWPSLRGGLVAGLHATDDPPAIVVDLGPAVDSFDVTAARGVGDNAELVIELRAAPRVTTSAPPSATDPAPVTPPPAADALPDFTAPRTLRVVAVDPGHGGNDAGSRGAEGALEKDITLSVARRLQAAVESRLGLRVVLTRSGDENVALDQRAAIANNNGADLFISLHANASPRPGAAGAEVFSLSISEYGDEARELAERAGPRLPVVGGGNREIDLVLWEMAQVRHVDQSGRLAELVDSELRRRVTMSQQPVQQAPFRVLVGANMPAVLVELGSTFDPVNERRLTSGRFQDAVVEAIVASIVRFRDELAQSGAVAGRDQAESRGSALLQTRDP